MDTTNTTKIYEEEIEDECERMKMEDTKHIHEEQISKENDENSLHYIINVSDVKKFKTYVMTSFKFDNLLTVDDKLNLTTCMIYNFPLWSDSEEFFEEECHLALVNWIYALNEKLRSGEDERVFHLLYNIILIFEVIPLKVADLLKLKIFQKLNKIRKLIKNKNLYYYEHLDNLLNYWTKFCSENYVSSESSQIKKRKRSLDEVNLKEDNDVNEFERAKKKVSLILKLNLINLNNLFIFDPLLIKNYLKTFLLTF